MTVRFKLLKTVYEFLVKPWQRLSSSRHLFKESIFRTRKRVLRYLVHSFLRAEGLSQAAQALVEEAGLTAEYEVCDNIDLDIIMQDYTSYYLSRFNKPPQFLRQVAPPVPKRPPTRQAITRTKPEPVVKVELPDTFTITPLVRQEPDPAPEFIPATERKSLSTFLANASLEKKHLVECLYQDIITPTGVSWDDIKGLEAAKSLLMESVVYPVRYPELFTGLLEPWRGVLLHGPPGTGKTLLARAVAAESRCTFFNVAPSTIVTKWRGDSEKIIKVLFEMASYYAPSIIFVDEADTLTSERAAGEHEASRRLKAQLLLELDGAGRREGIVFLLANSNMPWEIDPAMLRRLEKRIHIPLPDHKARAELFALFLSGTGVGPHLNELAERTQGYSGSDIKLVCKEALMSGVRKMLPNMGKGTPSQSRKDVDLSVLLTALQKTRPVAKNHAKRHETWQAENGCS